jgi:hypothetical protein
MRIVHILRSSPDALPPVNSDEWAFVLLLLLGANTGVAAFAWVLVGMFLD